MMRLAVVLPRYGREIGGGAEALGREYATRLAERAEVTALTTCALDYRTWRDHYPPGRSQEGGVSVLRFGVPLPRDEASFDALSARILSPGRASPEEEERWMDAQGPNAPGLLDHLADVGNSYDAVLFIPYLYATTVRGLPLVADRAVLVPAFHDEPAIRLGIYDEVVSSAEAVAFLTEEEQDLGRRRFGVGDDRGRLVGAGVEPAPSVDPARGVRALGLERPYVICVGRIDPSKGSLDLIDAHRRYRRTRPEGPDLVMIGRAVVEVPDEPWLHAPGYVDEQIKHDLIAGAEVLVAPSPFESLSLVLLEAWSHGVPTLASAASPVLVGQSRRSGGGLWFDSPTGYVAALDLLQRNRPLAHALGREGWRFARETSSWPRVMDRLWDAVEFAAGRKRHGAAHPAGAHDGVGATPNRSLRTRDRRLVVASPAGDAPLVRDAIARTGLDATQLAVADGSAVAPPAVEVAADDLAAWLPAVDAWADGLEDGREWLATRKLARAAGACIVAPARSAESGDVVVPPSDVERLAQALAGCNRKLPEPTVGG